jgi:hypothetical protein
VASIPKTNFSLINNAFVKNCQKKGDINTTTFFLKKKTSKFDLGNMNFLTFGNHHDCKVGILRDVKGLQKLPHLGFACKEEQHTIVHILATILNEHSSWNFC